MEILINETCSTYMRDKEINCHYNFTMIVIIMIIIMIYDIEKATEFKIKRSIS